MANDRVYLRCKSCGGTRLFLVHWGGDEIRPVFPVPNWNGHPNQPTAQDRLDGADAWLQEHIRCKFPGMRLDGDPRFELVTEDVLKGDA
jgi:hypothetical protein